MLKPTRTAAAAAVLAAVLAGCTSVKSPPAPSPEASTTITSPSTLQGPEVAPGLPPGKAGSPPVPLPNASQVDGQDAAAVSRAAVTITWTMDTNIDTSQHDAELRATPFYSDRHAREVAKAAPRAAPGAEWTTWSQHQAYTTVDIRSAEEDGRPSDSPTVATSRWSLTVTPVGRDGWRGTAQHVVAFTVLTRSEGQPWKLDRITIQ